MANSITISELFTEIATIRNSVLNDKQFTLKSRYNTHATPRSLEHTIHGRQDIDKILIRDTQCWQYNYTPYDIGDFETSLVIGITTNKQGKIIQCMVDNNLTFLKAKSFADRTLGNQVIARTFQTMVENITNKLNYLKESGTVIIGIHDDFTYEDIAI